VIAGASTVVVAGVFQELIQLMLQYEGTIGDVRDFFYTWEGLSVQGAVTLFVIAAVISAVLSVVRGRRPGVLTE
jgi:prolipoprotein diacylglyceryltransferase